MTLANMRETRRYDSGMSAVLWHFEHSNKRIRWDAFESKIAVTNLIGFLQRLHGIHGELLARSSSSPAVMA
jgi:hypothetical protein